MISVYFSNIAGLEALMTQLVLPFFIWSNFFFLCVYRETGFLCCLYMIKYRRAWSTDDTACPSIFRLKEIVLFSLRLQGNLLLVLFAHDHYIYFAKRRVSGWHWLFVLFVHDHSICRHIVLPSVSKWAKRVLSRANNLVKRPSPPRIHPARKGYRHLLDRG